MKKLKQEISKMYNTKYQKAFSELYTPSEILQKSLLIALLIEIIDYFNIFSPIAEKKEFIFVVIIILTLILIKILDFKPWNLYKLATVNYTDSMLVSSIIALFIYSIKLDIYNKGQYYKLITIICFAFVLLILELIRIRKINKIEKVIEPTNVYDLKDLYDGKIEKQNNKVILIKEKEVDYDLLERGNIINRLYELITHCYNGEKFVISLQGRWGSGKTTIINNLKRLIKKDSNIIIIDNFDPWSYENEQAMFKGMFDAIMREIGINFSIKDINNFLKFYIDTIFNNSKYENKYKIVKRYYSDIEDKNNKLKKIINSYLKNNNQKILFVIDNIERADKENINLLFKLVNNIFNFDNVIYLLSFDDRRMKEIFNNELENDYESLKKIIQLEIKVPKIDENVMENVVGRCIKNMMKLYEIEFNEKECKKTIELLSKRINDLRELKIYLNSVISFNNISNNNLNLQDTMLLELIKSKNIELYEEIWRNEKYFVSEDTSIFGKFYNYNIRGFNIEVKAYFDKLFKIHVNEEYKEILTFMFPYVDNYLCGREIKSENTQYLEEKGDYKTHLKDKRIFNARYFELYFSQCNNEFTNINQNIEKFIKIINNENNIEKIDEAFVQVMNLYNNWVQKFTFETLQLYLNDVINKYKFLTILLKHLKEYDDTIIFFGLSALQRIYIIIAELITEISKEEFEEFIQRIEKDYSKLETIREIEYWLENGENKFKEENISRKDKLKLVRNEMVERIIKNNINILERKYYLVNNLHGILEPTKNNIEERKKYINKILSQENIFKFLNDMLGKSISNLRIWICYKKGNYRRIYYRRKSRKHFK